MPLHLLNKSITTRFHLGGVLKFCNFRILITCGVCESARLVLSQACRRSNLMMHSGLGLIINNVCAWNSLRWNTIAQSVITIIPSAGWAYKEQREGKKTPFTHILNGHSSLFFSFKLTSSPAVLVYKRDAFYYKHPLTIIIIGIICLYSVFWFFTTTVFLF